MFAMQREQDLNISREQRQLDKDIAEARRVQDDLIAEKQRNMSEQQRAHELSIAQEQLRDSLLVTYMNDIGLLLKENNGSLTSDPVTAIIARAKTLNSIHQLDATRNAFLIRFLYEAKQLTSGANPLDLSDAELSGIDLSSENIFHRKLHNLSLAGAVLHNASFSKLDLSYANFSGSDLTNARFVESKMGNADFSKSTIADLTLATLSRAILIDANFDKVNVTRGGGNVTSIRINDHNGRQIGAVNFKRESDFVTMRTRTDSFQIELIVEFSSYGWCDDLVLTLETIPRNLLIFNRL
ncbi:unnamed protein product [Rotaria sp. Silwood1]|nr:unnamed protein product [Rotaria sp. Silwood1]CAF1627795.1 unnamed protein product [Rotaria sp. Silwood1]